MHLRDVLSPEDYLMVEEELKSLVHRARLTYASVCEPEDEEPLYRQDGEARPCHPIERLIAIEEMKLRLEVGAPDAADERLLEHSLHSSELYLGALFRAVVRMARAGRGRSLPPPERRS
ncbi:MAG TPA: hypothetical protein RMH99_01455 [Sandaracinaceae bacterium LLY-WYZ-13_1]|nr:hypothetical protein [Sandaracinaceae bacterium LLY-WYZ-13_1]